jgi:hypothetical protein
MKNIVVATLLVCGLLVPVLGGSDEIEEQGRAVLEANRDAVVTVELVVKMGMGGQEEESPSEASGVVLGPDGLCVLSLTATDPMALLKNMMGGMMGGMDQMKSQISSAKILLRDGREIPAHVILRDHDLDLAFLRPLEKPETPLPCLDVNQSASARVLQPVINILRLPKVANRVHSADLGRISAVVEKPRTFYVPSTQANPMGLLGTPVFGLDGKVIGLNVLRSIKSAPSGGGGLAGIMGGMTGAMQNMSPIIIPVADILEGAAQVPAWGEEKTEPTE